MLAGWTAASDLSTARCDVNHTRVQDGGSHGSESVSERPTTRAFVRDDLPAAMPIGCVKRVYNNYAVRCALRGKILLPDCL